MVGQASRHRRGTRPPQLGCATNVRNFGSWVAYPRSADNYFALKTE
jgi:hypothetical protein